MTAKKEKTVEQRIEAEYRKLKKVLDPKEGAAVKKIGEDLMRRAAFMKITLEDLEVKIQDEGCVCEYKNGANQYGTKKSPEVDVYNTMSKNYAAVIRQICDLLPERKAAIQDDGFDAFEQLRD